MNSGITKRSGLLALLFAVSLAASACAESTPVADTAASSSTAVTTTTSPPTTVPATTIPEVTIPQANFKACQVSDTGGIDDKSFNETAWNGALRARAEIEEVADVKFLESQGAEDFRPNIDSFIAEECDVIVTVGFLLSDDTGAAARENPGQDFAIIDFGVFPGAPWCAVDDEGVCTDDVVTNVRGLSFQTDEAAFLAGYAAAASSKSGVVGTFGGQNLPSVTIFMDGFYWGVQKYNADNAASVTVKGWDPRTAEGLFTGNFESTEDGFAFGESLIDEGADVILPVAGPVGLGTAQAAQDNGVLVVGVDADWTQSTDYGDVVLTSILKRMDNAVFGTINNLVTLGSLGNQYTGTLKNEGVGIAPVKDASDELSAALDELQAGIIAGTQWIGDPELDPAKPEDG